MMGGGTGRSDSSRRFGLDAALAQHGHWLLVALAAVLVYANSIANGFALDDIFIVQNNARVHQLADQSLIWTRPYWPSFGKEYGLYRPLTIFSFALQWAAGGGAPWIFHLCNVLVHALASVLALFLLRALVPAGPALFGALIFAVHPVHTEAVANIVGQSELIAGAATIGAALLYARRPSGPHVSWSRRLAVLALFVVGILAKESAIVLPGLLVAVDLAQRRVVLRRDSLVAYARASFVPMFLLTGAAIMYLAVRVDVLGSLGGVNAAPAMPFLREDDRILTAFRAWPEYLRLLFFPADLSADYSPAVILPVEQLAGLALLGAVLLLAVIGLALSTPWIPVIGLAAAWFFISILPTSNLILPVGIVVAERTLYTPSLAASICFAAAWRHLVPVLDLGRARVRAAAVAAATVLLLMGARTVIRNPDWMDLAAVWNGVVRDHPESYRSQWILSAMAPNNQVRVERLEFANKLWGYDPAMLSALAYEYLGFGRDQEAIEVLEHALSVVDFDPGTHVLLAYAYISAGRYRDAMRSATKADKLGAKPRETFPIWAQAFEGLGRYDEALAGWKLSVEHAPGVMWPYWAFLGRALARHGDTADALAAVDSALAGAPEADTSSLDRMARLRARIRAGCYGPDGSSDQAELPGDEVACDDPLSDWGVLMPLITTENASSSHIATEPTTNSPPDRASATTSK